jgi:hypothetical protein
VPEVAYANEVKIIQIAIELLRTENESALIQELERAQSAAGTSLEWYGITKTEFTRFLASRPLSEETRAALRDGIRAVRVMYE